MKLTVSIEKAGSVPGLVASRRWYIRSRREAHAVIIAGPSDKASQPK